MCFKTFAILFLFSFAICKAQDYDYSGKINNELFTRVLDTKIKTLRVFKSGWEFSLPIINLNTDEKIEISFDDLDANYKDYDYTVVHLNADRTQDQLIFAEYADGFQQNYVTDYSPSFNTQIPYIHYKINIPNDNISLKISGNYAVKIFKDHDPSMLVAISFFVVVDQKVKISALVKRPTLSKYAYNSQEVDFVVDHSDVPVNDAFSEISTYILQNNRWDNAVKNLKPRFVRINQLDYNYEEENIFNAGNEFRSFDSKYYKYKEIHTDSIWYDGTTYHFALFPDVFRTYGTYVYAQDLNGMYSIRRELSYAPETEADYYFVHFQLSSPMQLRGKLYLNGQLTNQIINSDYELKYNALLQRYTIDVLLKQGYYSYNYVYVPDDKSQQNKSMTEGAFYETENDYTIYIYHKPFGCRYQQLIGVETANSVKKY